LGLRLQDCLIFSHIRMAVSAPVPGSSTANSSPPPAGHHVALAALLFDDLGGPDQELVALLVPEGIVDQLQAVDVPDDQADGQKPLAVQPAQLLLEVGPVVQPGQLVVKAQVVDPLVVPAPVLQLVLEFLIHLLQLAGPLRNFLLQLPVGLLQQAFGLPPLVQKPLAQYPEYDEQPPDGPPEIYLHRLGVQHLLDQVSLPEQVGVDEGVRDPENRRPDQAV